MLSLQPWAIAAFSVIFAVGGPRNPALLSALTSNTPMEVRGLLHGAAQSIRALSMVVGGPLYGQIFSHYGHVVMGAPLYTAAIFDLLACVAAMVSFNVLDREIASGRISQSSPTGGEIRYPSSS